MSCRSAQNIATLPPAKFGESSGQGTLMKVHATHLYSTAEFHPAPVQKFRPGSGLALTNQNLPNKAGTCPTLSTTFVVQYSKRFPFIQAFSNGRFSNSKTAYHQCRATFLTSRSTRQKDPFKQSRDSCHRLYTVGR
jgi:hypothetical protein